ncbi:MAG: 50S ribosomal protein L19 [bacterium]|nr:50S ribosomal protein L19 [bacterium]
MSLPTHLQTILNAKYGRKDVPKLRVGETVRIHQQITEGKKSRIQAFEGVVIATKHGLGLNGSYTVRRIAAGGVGVEKTFPVHLPSVVKIEQVKAAKVRRAKLYYMRERFGKSARFSSEKMTGTSWQEELNTEVGAAEEAEKAADKTEATAAEAATTETVETESAEPTKKAVVENEPAEQEPVIEEATEKATEKVADDAAKKE